MIATSSFFRSTTSCKIHPPVSTKFRNFILRMSSFYVQYIYHSHALKICIPSHLSTLCNLTTAYIFTSMAAFSSSLLYLWSESGKIKNQAQSDASSRHTQYSPGQGHLELWRGAVLTSPSYYRVFPNILNQASVLANFILYLVACPLTINRCSVNVYLLISLL